MKRIIKLLVRAVCVILFSCCGFAFSVYAYDFTGFEEIAQTSKLKLYYNYDEVTFIVENKETGYLWSSFIREDQADISKLNAKWKNDLKSPFLLNYTNIQSVGGATLQFSVGGGKPELTAERINNGIRITSKFTIVEPLPLNAPAGTPPNPPSYITFSFEVTLDDDELLVKVPFDSIIEDGIQGIVSIEIFPSLGAALDGEQGYIFYPEGSGAIMAFDDLTHYRESRRSWNVYGSDIGYYISNRRNSDFERVMLPVYGSKIRNHAFLAIFEEGQQTSKINVTPSGTITRLNRVSGEFTYRRFFDDPRVATKSINRYDREIIRQDYTIRYMFLEEDKADYSGMANAYREYLVENNLIQKIINENDNIPLGLDFFMGINEKVLFFDSFVSMTKFDEAEKILSLVRGMGVTDIQTKLKGWTKRGYMTDPEHFPANRSLGGDSNLKNLAEYAQNNDIKLYLEANLIFGYNNRSGFSKRNDVAYLGNERIVSNEELYVLNPRFILDYFKNTFIKKADAYGVTGISYESLGEIVYYDYSAKKYSTKADTLDIWNEIINTSKETMGSVASVGGNQNTLMYSDRLAEIPEDSRGYFFMTDSVPFYQMVVHGFIPYSGSAGNLSYDFNLQKLKWIELGYMPYFELTHESAEKLNYTSYNELYTSQYTEWVDLAAEVYKEFNDNLKGVWSAHMISHEKTLGEAYRIRYDNGTAVYVNYNKYDINVDGYVVRALDYLVID